MKTLAQIRGSNARQAAKVRGIGAGQKEGDALSGLPMMIRTCGLMAALAYAMEPKKENNFVEDLASKLNSRGKIAAQKGIPMLLEIMWFEGTKQAEVFQAIDREVGQLRDRDDLRSWQANIREKGTVGAIAIALRKHPGEYLVAAALARHLRYRDKEGRIAITDAETPDDLLDELAEAEATKLRRATAETLAYLNFLKRFVA